MEKRVCVIGGGISGLSTAVRLSDLGYEVTVLEKGRASGGNVRSERREGFLLEKGPNSMLITPQLYELIERLGLSEEIASARPAAKKRYIVKNGILTALPSGVWSLLSTRAISARAKLRLLAEPFIRSRSADNETISAFFERRLGREIVDHAVDPFVSGVYAGNPEKLAVKEAFPTIHRLEKDHGSLFLGVLFSKKQKGSNVPKGLSRSISFMGGMQTLTDRLADVLGDSLRTEAEAKGIAIEHGGRYVVTVKGSTDDRIRCDAVVISSPSLPAADLLEGIDSRIASKLRNIRYPPIAVVHTAFQKEDVEFDPDGFGFLVPSNEERRILGSLWTSEIFEGRAPEGYHLMTTFVGGARNPELAGESDETLVRIVLEELDSVVGLAGSPVLVSVKKWERSIPQYDVGYGSVVDEIARFSATNKGIFFCSNFLSGISVGDCVKNSGITAEKIAEYLAPEGGSS
ncbi:MAG TPA: protoporphyrinogen oxidase [Aridibacter sp.]|nr:protoporphyrinogen oxidase [Aridibacter sp.]